jgi:patatin-like phospholipase/acyl hydrolase
MRILSIDGGGVRGTFAAQLLLRIGEEYGIRYHEAFDLIVGTSSGCITAAALSIDYPLDGIAALFDDSAGRIFKPRWFGSLGLLAPRYDTRTFTAEVIRVFGTRKMSDALTLLMIPATNIETGDIHVFASRHKHVERGLLSDTRHVPMADAVLASCAAPTFFTPHRVDDKLLVDGGLWANNPAMLGLIAALLRFNSDVKDIRMLSIGAGSGYQPYMVKHRLPVFWGLLTGLGLIRPFELMMGLQANGYSKFPSVILSSDQFLRLNFEEHHKVRLDNMRTIPDLKRKANEVFKQERDSIHTFVSTLH